MSQTTEAEIWIPRIHPKIKKLPFLWFMTVMIYEKNDAKAFKVSTGALLTVTE